MIVGESLVGGAINDVVRVGDRVHRTTGPWRRSVHDLLAFLHRNGFHGAPRPIGVDEAGREVLSFVPGRAAIEPLRACERSDATLVQVGGLLRRFHDVSARFVPAPDARWRWMPGAPRHGDVIGHNDLSTDNTVLREGRPVAFIDFEFAAPAPRYLDVAALALAWVPLGAEAPPDAARRLWLLADAYGVPRGDRCRLVEFVRLRLRIRRATHERLAPSVPGFGRLVAAGSLRRIALDEAWLDQTRLGER